MQIGVSAEKKTTASGEINTTAVQSAPVLCWAGAALNLIWHFANKDLTPQARSAPDRLRIRFGFQNR
jgi:hypothetical protein